MHFTDLCGYEIPRPPGCTLLGRQKVHHAGLVLPLPAPRCLPGVPGRQPSAFHRSCATLYKQTQHTSHFGFKSFFS